MRKEWRVYTFLGVMFVLYVILNYYAPKPLNWSPTFHPSDKNPYGCFVLFDRMEDLFSGSIQASDKTLYELQDSIGHIVVIAVQGNLAAAEVRVLLERVADGGEVLLAAEQFSQLLQDTLQFATQRGQLLQLPNATDSTDVTFEGGTARLSDVLVQTSFDLSDTRHWEVLAETDEPVLITRKLGRGRITLSSTPLAFTNFALLQDHRLAHYALTRLSDQSLQYSYYYQTGKIRSNSPFRYVLTQASLKWALYLSLLLIGCLLLFDSQRRQRMVQVIAPPQNSTVQFVKTIGALFYREKNNKKIALKLSQYFQEELYRKYHKSPAFTEKYYEWLAHKTGLSKTHVIQTFQAIQHASEARQISDSQLKDFNGLLTQFSL